MPLNPSPPSSIDSLPLRDQLHARSFSASLNLSKPAVCGEHYLVPNEYYTRNIHYHFNPKEGGVHICVGTERFFQNALLSPRRDLFIGLDLDDQVIAYNQLNCMLLELSTDRDDFNHLANPPDSPEEKNLVLRKRLEASSLPEARKNYYLAHLEGYSELYYTSKGEFLYLLKQLPAAFVNYHEDDAAFQKLQLLAKNGDFVFLCGTVNDLRFLPSSVIAEIDVSNVPDYTPLNFHLKDSFPDHSSSVWCIWVRGQRGQTAYSHFQYDPLTTDEQTQMAKCCEYISEAYTELNHTELARSWGFFILTHFLGATDQAPISNSRKLLKMFATYCSQKLWRSPHGEVIDIVSQFSKMRALLRQLSKDQLSALSKESCFSVLARMVIERNEKEEFYIPLIAGTEQGRTSFEAFFDTQNFRVSYRFFQVLHNLEPRLEEFKEVFGRDRFAKLEATIPSPPIPNR